MTTPRHPADDLPRPAPGRLLRRLGAVAVVGALLLAGCGDGGDETATTTPSSLDSTDAPASSGEDRTEQPTVVASTSWVAAFALAAGIDDVSIVAPIDLQHPPDYDPKPSDLAAIADADFVLVAGFEGFAERMADAVDGDAELITLQVDNTPSNIREQVQLLADTFGTEDRAQAWIDGFDARVAELEADLSEARGDRTVTAVAHTFMAYWTDLAGIEVVGTWGPQPASPGELAEFTSADPDLILLNAHVPAGGAFDDLSALGVEIRNFPDDSLDLIEVFEANAAALAEALGELDAG